MNNVQLTAFNLFALLAIAFAQFPDEETTTVPTPSPTETTTLSTAETTTLSTTAEITTTPPFTTTKSPSPSVEEGSWNITEGNVTCIRAVLQIGIVINLGDEKLNFSLSPSASDSGSSCSVSNITQQLELSSNDYRITFLFEKDADHVYVKNLTLVYTSPETTETFYADSKLFTVKAGNSYLCKTAEDIEMQNATMRVHKIHLQAFATAGEDNFGESQECEADDVVNDTIVIAVACALAGLIIIVLVAYLIGRRRLRQRGYTSV